MATYTKDDMEIYTTEIVKYGCSHFVIIPAKCCEANNWKVGSKVRVWVRGVKK